MVLLRYTIERLGYSVCNVLVLSGSSQAWTGTFSVRGKLLDGTLWFLPSGVHAFYNFVPLCASGICDLLLTNRIWQIWQDVTHVIMLHYTTLSCKLTCCGDSSCWLDEVSGHMAENCKLPLGDVGILCELNVTSNFKLARNRGPQAQQLQGICDKILTFTSFLILKKNSFLYIILHL